MQIPHHCTLCPRACGADRAAGQRGFCGADNTLRVARAALHHWEEPCLSGDPNAETGSGTVFFSGCTLKCCYCQNYPISQGEVGKAISVERLTEIFMNLQNGGAKNINLVTASQYLPWVTAALDAARAQGFSLPVVYNTGGYETVDAVKALAGYVDIWLADYKYADGALAAELSAARDYPAVADAALRQMLLQTGAPVYDADGYLQKGVIVRHLALPGHVADSKAVLRRLAALREETGVEFIPSLMSQFTPFYKAAEHGLGRRITTYEYRQVIDEAVRLGLTDGYMQERAVPGRSIHRRLIWRGCKLTQKPPAACGGGRAGAGGGRRLPLPHRLRAEPPRKRRGLRNCEVLHVIFRFLSFLVSLRRSAVGPAGGAGRVGCGDRAAGLRVRRVAAGRAACTVCGGTGLLH